MIDSLDRIIIKIFFVIIVLLSYSPMMLGKRIHRERYAVAGHARYLTFSCFHNLPLFKMERCCLWFTNKLAALHAEGTFDLWAWVLMPTHVHLLIMPHDSAMISKLLFRLKKSTANTAIKWLRDNAPDFLQKLHDRQPSGKETWRFWQRGGGYDRNIHSENELHEKIRYIHGNPVRAGLVTRPKDWMWSSFQAWKTDENIPIAIDRDSLPPRTQ